MSRPDRPDQGTLVYCCVHGDFGSEAQSGAEYIWDQLGRGASKKTSGVQVLRSLRPINMAIRKKKDNYYEFLLRFPSVVTTKKVHQLIFITLTGGGSGKSEHDPFLVKREGLESCLHSLAFGKGVEEWKQFSARNAQRKGTEDSIMGLALSLKDVEAHGRQASAEAAEDEFEELKKNHAVIEDEGATEDASASDTASSQPSESEEPLGGSSTGNQPRFSAHGDARLRQQIKATQQELESVKAELESEKAEKVVLREKLIRAEEAGKVNKERRDEQMADKEKQIKDQQDHHNKELQRYENIFALCGRDKIQDAEAKREIEETHQSRISRLRDEIEALKRANGEERSKFAELEQRCQDKDNKIAELEQSRTELVQRCRDKEMKLSEAFLENKDLKERVQVLEKDKKKLEASHNEEGPEYQFVRNITHVNIKHFQKVYGLYEKADYMALLDRQMSEQIKWYVRTKTKNPDVSRLPEGKIFTCTSDQVFKALYEANIEVEKARNPNLTKEDKLKTLALCRTYVRFFFHALIDRENNEHVLAPVLKKRKREDQIRTYSFVQTGGVVTIESVVRKSDGSERTIQAKITKVDNKWWKEPGEALDAFLEGLQQDVDLV